MFAPFDIGPDRKRIIRAESFPLCEKIAEQFGPLLVRRFNPFALSRGGK